MKKLSLTRNLSTYVNDDVYNVLLCYNWQAHYCRDGNYFLASRSVYLNGRQVKLFLHRLLAGVPSCFRVRRKNNDFLDNQHYNLIISDKLGNRYFFRHFSTKSRYKGVFWSAYHGIWETKVYGMTIGYYRNEIDAARAFNIKMTEIHPNAKYKRNKITIMRRFNEKNRLTTGSNGLLHKPSGGVRPGDGVWGEATGRYLPVPDTGRSQK